MGASLDRKQATDAFGSYTAAYDPGNPRISLKIDHTMRVASLCERIAGSIRLPAGDVELAWLLGLLHDIGRFEQVRRYGTFNDAATESHASLGVEALFGDSAGADGPLIRRFVTDAADDNLIRTAVGLHSAYRLPEELDERTRTLCEVLRDADKIDIVAVNGTCPIEDIYGVTERDMEASALTPACVDIFYEHRCLPRGVRRHPADILLGHVCFAWELVFDESLAILREQGHLARMLDRRWEDPTTRETFAAMAAHMRAELGV